MHSQPAKAAQKAYKIVPAKKGIAKRVGAMDYQWIATARS